MSAALFGGIITGLIIALSTGPVFFTLIHTAIHKGFRKSIYFILGISFTDISIILICWFGLNQIGVEFDQKWLSIVAGIVLLLFGVSFITKKSKPVIDDTEVIKKSRLDNLGLFFKAILIDVINPIVWIFWAAISEYSISNFDTKAAQVLYFGAILAIIFTTDMMKSYFAQRLKSFLSEKYVNYINYGIGVFMIGIGLKLIFFS